LVAPIGQTLDQAAPRREQTGLFHNDLLTPGSDRGQGGSASPKTMDMAKPN
jgi:hypothetical protein